MRAASSRDIARRLQKCSEQELAIHKNIDGVIQFLEDERAHADDGWRS